MGSYLTVLLAAVAILVLSGLNLDRESQRGIIFRSGRVKGTMGPGM